MSAMNEYLPVLIVGGIIGAFTIVFLLAYAALRKETDRPDKERNIPDREIVRRLMQYAKPYWKSFVLVFFVVILVLYIALMMIRNHNRRRYKARRRRRRM